MPRHRRVPRTPKVPKPKKVKIPRPRAKELRMILKGLMTVSLANRIASLTYALQWYDQAIPYAVSKQLLDVKAKKLLDIAVKCRKQGIGTSNDDEQETSFLMALRQYEKALASLKPPAVDKFYDLFKKKRVALEAKQKKLENKFGNVVQLLEKSIGGKLKLKVADAQKPFQYDPTLTSLSYNREASKAMALQFRREGLLAVFSDQLDILSRHAALQPDGAGGWQYDPAIQVQTQQDMLKAFVAFAQTGAAPKKLVRASVAREPRQPKVPSQAGAAVGPRPPRAPRTGVRVLGFLVPGTAIHTVYERLKDEKEHEMSEVIAGITTGDPVGRVKQLARYGREKGSIVVTITGNKVQLKHTPQQTGAAQP